MKILTILFLTLSSLIIPFKNTNATEANIILEQSHIKKLILQVAAFGVLKQSMNGLKA